MAELNIRDKLTEVKKKEKRKKEEKRREKWSITPLERVAVLKSLIQFKLVYLWIMLNSPLSPKLTLSTN